MADTRAKRWQPLDEVMFATNVNFPGGPRNMLGRGHAYVNVMSLDAEMTDRVIRAKFKKGGTVIVPFENVTYFRRGVLQRSE